MEQRYPLSYISYLSEFHATRDFFECHELLEEYWKEHPNEPLTDTWHGLIQLAVGLYHHRRGNRAGALKMWAQALIRLHADKLEQLGLDGRALLSELAERRKLLELDATYGYTDMTLSIQDAQLKAACLQQCEENGWVWGMPSSEADESVIHRHLTRDRSEVVAARALSAEQKRQARHSE
ncbi:protein of unknown function DUF309 [Paenibacillus curdlanolyticus YK9]|uniref:DUF309 domain-containing protein n=1 Tax=Paenibacillus curdlanolyticus YK9 TaxID=717606 RepID=E0I511_9BACL|nr:DUF309 domain-containing protein [Paenibacillus curdlanolyticus]EFM12053.1 protein of unknown function DUF309 [Paenibacillus curdlanolyticus YK9]